MTEDTSTIEYLNVLDTFKKLPREDLEELLFIFSEQNDSMWKTMQTITALNSFRKNQDYQKFQQALLVILDIDDYIPFDKSGQYRFVIAPIVEFFNENKHSKKLLKILENILPLIEESGWNLEDENSWYNPR